MKINQVQKSTNFGRFRTTTQGAFVLAGEFKKNPAVEEKFMKKIVKPLENSKLDIIFNGYTTLFQTPKNVLYSIFSCHFGSNEYTIVPRSGELAYVRTGFRPDNNIPVKKVEDFVEYPFSEIEGAKNIVENMQMNMDKKLPEIPIEKPEIPSNHPMKKEIDRLMDLFG